MARKKRKQGPKPAKKKPETSKLIALWAVLIATASVIASYTLAALGHEPVSDLTIAIFTACAAELIAYAGKSLGEKISRNKYGLDADGKPLASGTPDEEEAKG